MNPIASAPPPEVTRIDAAVARVAHRKDAWVREPIPARITYLRKAIAALIDEADEWVRLGCEAKGIDPASPLAGEEWFSGPTTTVRTLRLLLEALEAGGQPRLRRVRARPDGQLVADVFPEHLIEWAVYSGMTAEVWIEPGQPATQGRIYRQKRAGIFPPGRVCLVLGAGNVSSIAPLDLAYKLFAEDEVVILKMNPVNTYLAPIFRRVFEALLADGYLEIVEGGVDVGQYLTAHPQVDSIHLTGSERTHDAIVWGDTVEEQERRKRAGTPRIDKHVTSELGSVTPVLVVPGRWSDGDVAFQARHVASMVANNASFNCNAAKVLVLARGWAQREQFLDRLGEAFMRLPARRAYYPGARDRYREFKQTYPNARVFGTCDADAVPWTLIPNVPVNAGEYALTREAFCAVLAEVSLDVGDAPAFLREAVPFANEHVWGTLSAVMLVDAPTMRRHRDAVEEALAALRYGAIGVNVWSGATFGLGVTTWGAFPGSPLENIRSGRGVVHNAMLLDHPQKSIVRGAFRLRPTPVWFADHRNLAAVGRRGARYEANPSLGPLIALGLAGLKG
jgi:acyl-CoA reductase-like NAD-dependent aldehyde dehydrogenase